MSMVTTELKEEYRRQNMLDVKEVNDHKSRKIMGLTFGVIALFLVLWLFLFAPPRTFPAGKIITVAEGMSLGDLAESLSEQHAIRNATIFKLYVTIRGADERVVAGDYLFDERHSVLGIANRMIRGTFGDSRIKVVVFEGLTIEKMVDIFEFHLKNFDVGEFLWLTEGKEGYLFPDTYFFFPSATTARIVETMEANFVKQTEDLADEIVLSGHTLGEIIVMASIIEREAFRGLEEKRTIAGILWKRIDRGIPLQVDAPFAYLLNKNSSQLTNADLNSDSPFNTYRNRGLPPSPIANPGLDAIKAALDPKDSPYLYYLHDKSGQIHYAETFSGHQRNIDAYLK